ncbi:hypothetical protein [uncultured Erythrobacter sp.]|uniref:hypothetical protein n=1 Tax=uncultured Erythrobacter sp. TaxID=263913 RepID=UPI002635CE61|nr:hypothetical protein [uncultured Erythrobacter sp.]
MITFRASLWACVGLVAITATPAIAAVDEYSIEPSQRLDINLDVCSAESQLAVRGDSGTDLDFEVISPSGAMLVSDAGIDDYLSLVLENESEDCRQFKLSVSNLGDEKNDFTVMLEPIMASSTRVKKYIVQGEMTEVHGFKACGTSASVSARGDGDTDLDFIVRNSDGGIVHEDAGTGDQTTFELAGLLSDCEMFEIEVTNLGGVYNAMMLVVEPKGLETVEFAGTAPATSLAAAVANGVGGEPHTVEAEGSGPGTYKASANTQLMVNLPVCGVRRLEVRGSGVSDLDFTLADSEGAEVHTDMDLSDVTFKTLEPSGECETYRLAVNNIGATDNSFEVALIDPSTRVGDLGQGEYLIDASASTKFPLQICAETRISARGEGRTDLDFDVTDSSGNSMHSDYDLTDATEFTIDPKGACKDYQISVSNLGDTNNMLTIAFGEAAVDPRKQDGPFVVGPTQPNSAIARPGQIAGFRKGLGGENAELNRNISLMNRTGEALESLYWSNSATMGWGKDRLATASLARNQQWNIEVTDGSEACIFDFKAVTTSERVIEVGQINVCEESAVTFE